MTRKIFKYPLETTDHQEVEMPIASVILCVQVQHGIPCLWAMVNTDPELAKEKRKVRICGTGHDVDDHPDYYVGTYQLQGGALVFHVFAR